MALEALMRGAGESIKSAAEVFLYLRKKGRPIPTNNLWIAALVLQHNLVLLDRDSDFDSLPQLARYKR